MIVKTFTPLPEFVYHTDDDGGNDDDDDDG